MFTPSKERVGMGGNMLVLTRKAQESLVIDGNIIITVLGVMNGKVKLGLQAPLAVNIRRSELADTSEPAPDLDREIHVGKPESRLRFG